MASRPSLHEEFVDVLNSRTEEDKRVYFNPPESVKLKYPCIKYSRSSPDLKRANDRIYRNTNRYEVILIDRNPDSELRNEILTRFPMCSLDREYKAEGLNHFVYTIYY